MAEYRARIEWSLNGAEFTDKRYSRGHSWHFDEGLEVPASASPESVPLPYSVAKAVDPEEAYVASLSSCHMLWFLSIAAKRGFVVESYSDEAVGLMARNASSKIAMTVVTLRPDVVFGGATLPSADDIHGMHNEAHDQCFIANSVMTEVRCEPVGDSARTDAHK